MPKNKICILVFSNIAWDSRVLRQVAATQNEYSVDVIAFGDWSPPSGVRYFQLQKTTRNLWMQAKYLLALLLGRIYLPSYEYAYWMHNEYGAAKNILIRGNYDLIHANDWNSLPVSVYTSKKNGSKVLFDAHEYSFTEEAGNLLWRFLIIPYRDYLYRVYGEMVDAKVTVAAGIEKLYQKHFGWDMNIILNAPYYKAVKYSAALNDKLKIVHHGAALENRRLEDFISLVSLLDKRFELYFYLLPSQIKYYKYLQNIAQKTVPGRIHFMEPLLPQDLVAGLAGFDVGIPLISATQSTYYNALPNKFFDYIMSGLAVIVTPLPMMSRIVEEYKIGEVSLDQTPSGVAEILNALTVEEINAFKMNSLKLARNLNADVEMKKLKGIYNFLLNEKK